MKIKLGFKSKDSELKGFTLIELLVSLFILTTISSLVIGIVWISLKSTVKANNLSVIRQNGNFAMLQMAKMLQFSKEFQGVSNNGNTFNFNCQNPGNTLQKYNYVRFTGSDDEDTILGCTSGPSTISSISASLNKSISLINTAKFKLTSCDFTCTQVNAGLPYTIGIKFTIEKKTPGNIFDEPAPLVFKNSVTLRNSSN